MMIPTASKRTELQVLAQDFQSAVINNDMDALTLFNAEFAQLVLEMEEASSANQISADEARVHLELNHNIYVLSSSTREAQLALDEISDEFDQHLQTVVKSVSAMTVAFSCPSSPESATQTGDNDSSLSNSHHLLRNWSQLHMSYLFPSKKQREELACQTSMSQNQIFLWFRNARTRSGWSKLYAQRCVQKDPTRLQSLIAEYQSLKGLHGPEEFQEIVTRNESYQLLNRIYNWFTTAKQAKPVKKSQPVKPWLRNVLSTTLASFKQGASCVLDSSKQLLPEPSPGCSSGSSTRSPSAEFTASSSAPSSSGYLSDSSDLHSSHSPTLLSSITSPVVNSTPVPSGKLSLPSTLSTLASLESLPKDVLSTHLPACLDLSCPFSLSSLCMPTNHLSSLSHLSSSAIDSLHRLPSSASSDYFGILSSSSSSDSLDIPSSFCSSDSLEILSSSSSSDSLNILSSSASSSFLENSPSSFASASILASPSDTSCSDDSIVTGQFDDAIEE